MKKVLKCNKRTKAYIDSLPKMHIVGCWAKYGVNSYPFSGKYVTVKGESIPLVYEYYDGNGEVAPRYNLVRVDHATSGVVLLWLQNHSVANNIARLLNKETERIIKEMNEGKEVIKND